MAHACGATQDARGLSQVWGQSDLHGEFHVNKGYLMRPSLKKTKWIRKNNKIFSPVIKIRKMCLYCMCACVLGWVWSPFILFPETVSLTGLEFTDYGKQASWPGSPGSHQPLRPRCWDWKQEPLQAAFLMALVSAKLSAACTFTQSLRFISFFHHLLLLEVLQS